MSGLYLPKLGGNFFLLKGWRRLPENEIVFIEKYPV